MGSAAKKTDGWCADLQLTYAQQGQRTVLARRQHIGPLLVQRPFYPENDVCHSYIIHPPGGIVGGDQLSLEVTVEQHAHALLTTPASGKFYNSGGLQSKLVQNFIVADDAVLEWLPQDNIFYEGAQAAVRSEIKLEQSARFIGWEINCLGRPFSNKKFDQGFVDQHMHITRSGEPVMIDRSLLQSQHEIMGEPWGLADYTVSATLLATPVSKGILEQLRPQLETQHEYKLSASLLDDVLVCRYLGHHGAEARQVFEQLWSAIRPAIADRVACPPRIWRT